MFYWGVLGWMDGWRFAKKEGERGGGLKGEALLALRQGATSCLFGDDTMMLMHSVIS